MKQLWIVWALAAALAVGCKRSELQNDDELATSGKARVSLALAVAQSPIVHTKAAELQTSDEKTVANLWVFVFKDDLLKEVHQVASIDKNTASVVLGMDAGLDLYAFANVTDAVEDQLEGLPIGTTKPEDLKAVTGDVAEVTSLPLPMWGKVFGVNVTPSTDQIQITMTRSCARFDAAVNASGVTDFTLHGIVRVLNVPKTATLYPAPTLVAAGADTTSFDVLLASAYAYENAISTDADAMHLIVKGTYKGIEGYYKLRVQYDQSGAMAYTIGRNKIYSFTISKVNAPGFASIREASVNAPQNVSYDVTVTDVDAHDLMVSNGQYYLGLTNSEYVAYADGDLSGVLATLTHNADATLVKTDGTITVEAIPSGSLALATTSIPVGTKKLHIQGTLRADLTSATIKIRLGNLYQEVKVGRNPSLLGLRGVLADFSGPEYVAVEDTESAPWLLLGASVSTCMRQAKAKNPFGGLYVVAEKNSDALRSSVLYVDRSGSGGRVKVYVSQDVPFVQVGLLYWAKGNLIATGAQGTAGLGGCTIGSPTDGGLYFQFGSLIGYKGGKAIGDGRGRGVPDFAPTNNIAWNGVGSFSWANDAMVWPIGYTNTPGWVSGATDNAACFGSATPPYETIGQQLSDFPGFVDGSLVSSTVAVGDPCRYYLGDLWRLPSDQEYGALFRWKSGMIAAGSFITSSWGRDVPQLAAANAPGYDNNNSAALGRGIYTNTLAGAGAAADPNALFFPAVGFRESTNGTFYSVGKVGFYWSNSIHNDVNGFTFNVTPTTIQPQGTENRAFGYPVRCVADVLAVDRPMVVIPLSGGSETIKVSTLDSWTATAHGPGVSVSPTSGEGSGSIVVTYSALASGVRAGTVTIVSGGTNTVAIHLAQRTIMSPSPDDYVTIGNVKWAKGNLVAQDEYSCRVGDPQDGGLYFQFGSLIGWKGGALINGGTGVGANPYTGWGTQWWGGGGNPGSNAFNTEAMVWPVELTTTPTGWPSNDGSSAGDRTTVVDQWHLNYNVIPYDKLQSILDLSASFAGDKGGGNLGMGRYAKWGVGDPCTYYLGAPWRQPTAAEYSTLFNGVANNTAWGSVASWAWQASPAGAKSSGLFFPASGLRYNFTGAFYYVGVGGYYWSSSVRDAMTGYTLNFNNGTVSPQTYYRRSVGFPVRCVSSVP